MRMNGSYLLDTNIVIALFANDSNVLQQLSVTSQIFIPSIVLGELYYGANKSAHSKSNIVHIDNFAMKSAVLVCDTDIARHYGHIKDHLRAKGNPIPENDIWIAALAKQYDLTLSSRDQHFRVIKEIKVEQW
jgi:tRNA(fMet)-specific endonuclease VapC